MESTELKETLKTFPRVEKVFITSDGGWYFQKPMNVETTEFSREDILGEKKEVEAEGQEAPKSKKK
jgi:hypothetical protein